MRNLLFGSYPTGEDESVWTKASDSTRLVTEVASFDALEKTICKKVADHNEKVGYQDLALLPNR